MVDKSKMSVADILAAARKADGGGNAPGGAAKKESAAPEAAPPEPSIPSREVPARAVSPPPGKAAAGARRPSVADILAAARAEKQEKQAEPAAAAAPEKVKPAAKSAAKPAAKPAAKKEAVAVKAGPVDTQSILAAARTAAKPGPMTKAEAAAKGTTSVPAAKKARAKEAIVVPPMPAKPDYAKPPSQRTKDDARAERRALLFGISALAVGFGALSAWSGISMLAVVRFMFPNILREPPSQFSVGFPDQIPPGHVEERYRAEFGVWIVNAEYQGVEQIFALKAVCTHLGCTPNWLEAEQKFKCPCHGSGFYKDGINFEGPAPRPLERYAVAIASDGQIEVDKSRTFQEEMGQWDDPNSFIPA